MIRLRRKAANRSPEARPAPSRWRLTVIKAAALCALLLSQIAWATTYHARSPEEMVLAADMIFVGTVDELTESIVDGTPWTEVTFRVESWSALSGEPVPPTGSGDQLTQTVTLTFMGGTDASGGRLTVSGVPQFRLRERVLALAYDQEGLVSPIVGVSQGLWRLDARGARLGDGSFVNVPEPGRLALAPEGSGLAELQAAIQSLLESGVLPTDPPDEQPPGASGDLPPSDPEPGDDQAPSSEQAGAAEPATPPASDAGGGAAAQQPSGEPTVMVHYTVDESGGPLLLSAALERAAATWEAAASGAAKFVELDEAATPDPETPAAVHEVGYGDAASFGPDALSFTLVSAGSGPARVMISPAVGDALDAVLVHELGVLMGLPEGGPGVMSSAVTADQAAPTPEDVSALRDLLTFRPEDINRDGLVDFYDLAALAEAYGARGVNLAADLNGDGVVDDADLELLRQAYEFLPPAETAPN